MKKTNAVRAFLKRRSRAIKNNSITITSSHTNVHAYGEPQRPLTYIKLSDHKIKYTKKISDRVYIDFDRRNQVVGLEVI